MTAVDLTTADQPEQLADPPAQTTYRASCEDPACGGWKADDAHQDEDTAWSDARAHVDAEHWPCVQVRPEATP